MFIRHLARLHRLMGAEQDDGSGSAGGAAVDRGDELTVEGQATEVEDEGKEEQTTEDVVAEVMGEKPRDETGKFAKKEKAQDDGNRIPKARFDDAVSKERNAREAAEARASAAEARLRKEEQSVEASKYDTYIEGLEVEHSKLLLDGESEKASAVMKQIRMAERELSKMENNSQLEQATSKAVEQVRWDAAVASLEAQYATLNPQSEDYDQDMTDIVIAEQHRMMRVDGLIASRALTMAAAKIMGKFQNATAVDAAGAKGLAAAKANTSRKADQVSKNLNTAARQPGSMKASGIDSDAAGDLKAGGAITRAEFEAMPEATKAKLRGDYL